MKRLLAMQEAAAYRYYTRLSRQRILPLSAPLAFDINTSTQTIHKAAIPNHTAMN